MVVVGERLSVRDESGEELDEVVWVEFDDFVVEVVGRGESVIDLLIIAEKEKEAEVDPLSCGDSDADAETLGDEDDDCIRDGLISGLKLLDDDNILLADWETDAVIELDCFGERECDGVEVSVLDICDEDDADGDSEADFVDLLDEVIVGDTMMEEVFFAVTVEDFEPTADAEEVTAGDDDSEAEEE